jgi:hypothetical protein
VIAYLAAADLLRYVEGEIVAQLGIGNKIGFSKGEREYLEKWIADSNREALQQRMERGVKY